MADYQQTGYLDSDFRVFHLTDTNMEPIDFHLHDFHKILIVLQGNLSYCIAGRTYTLSPWDIVFVPAGDVHRPIIHDSGAYERIIIYISPNFLAGYQGADYDLSLCFQEAHRKQSHVLRVPAIASSRIGQIVHELEHSLDSDEYAGELYRSILFLEFMVHLNRAAIHNDIEYIAKTASNDKMIAVLNYINEHLTEKITVEDLAENCYINRYHLMHCFKDETGYTIGSYLTTKRLLLAQTLIDQGHPLTSVCYECGFHTYSSFFRAYRKHYGYSPRKMQKIIAPPSH